MSNLKQLKMKTTQLFYATMILFLFATIGAQAQDKEEEKRKRNFGTHNFFDIDLGINNFLEDGQSPDENNAAYAVKPWGSWYVALKSVNETHVGGPFNLQWGVDVSWYNFKFQNEALRLSEDPNQIIFGEETGDFSPIKSKLTAAYINVSLVPMLKFGERSHHSDSFHWHGWRNDGGFRIGAGGYAGYKIASYAKYVTEVDGDKDKDRDKDGFYLNNFRYGVRLQMGFRDVDVFVNYDLNELFAENRGPQLNAFSFGVVL